MDCSVLLLRHLYPCRKRVCIAHIAWVAHRYGQLYLHCSLIYFWVPSSCFCIVISLLEGEIIPFSGVCQSGGRIVRCIIHAGGGGGFTHWLTDCFTCNRRRPAATSSRRASFSALASANLRILHRAQQTSRWRICMSVPPRSASFSSLAFLSRWAL